MNTVKQEQQHTSISQEDSLDRSIYEKDQHIASLQNYIQSLQKSLYTTQQSLRQKEQVLMEMQNKSFLGVIKNFSSGMQWALHHPLRFLKKHIWRGIPTYPQIIWALYNPKKFFKKHFLRHKVSSLYSPYAVLENNTDPRIAVIVHISDETMWEEIHKRLQYIQESFHIIITLVEGHDSKDVIQKIKDIYSDVQICVYKNQESDLLSFVRALSCVPNNTRFVLKLHAKNILQEGFLNERQCNELLDYVLPDEKTVQAILHNLEYSDAGMIGGGHTKSSNEIVSSDKKYTEKMYTHMHESYSEYVWMSGGIFWIRYDILEKMISQKFVSFLEQDLREVQNEIIIQEIEQYIGKLVYDAGKVIYTYPQSRYSHDYITLIPNNHSMQETKRIYVFFHICCLHDYAAVVHEIIQSMQQSGLYDACEEIYYAILGDPTDSFLRVLKTYSKMKCVYQSFDVTEVEYPLLRYMQEFSYTHDAYLFYCHTKGVSQVADPVKTKWRERLVEKNIKEYQTCVSFLNKGCDIAGCGWKEHPVDDSVQQPFSVHTHSHFSGNFWWAQSIYIRKLPSIQEIELLLRDTKNKSRWGFELYRLECEMWIGQGEKKYVGVNTDLNIEYTKSFFNLT